MSKLSKILLPNPDWRVKKINFNSKKMKQSIECLIQAKQEADERSGKR